MKFDAIEYKDGSIVRKKIIMIYLITSFLAIAGASISLYYDWKQTLSSLGAEMIKDNLVNQIYIKDTVIDSMRLLKIVSHRIENPAIHSNLKYRLHDILCESRDEFILFNRDNIGILLVTDAEGSLIARSDEKEVKGINFSDRYWFQQSKNNQDTSFAIGPLLNARTTGKYVFHVSKALINSKGNFTGVVSIQISHDKLLDFISHSPINTISLDRKIVNKEHEIIYSYPTADNINSNFGVRFYPKYYLPNNWYTTKTHIIVQTSIEELGIESFNELPLNIIFNKFLSHKTSFIIYSLFAFILITFIFLRFYNQVGELESEKLLSHYDMLTELPNRYAFLERCENLFAQAQLNGTSLSVLFIDIDHFKDINDTYGHNNGDIVLKYVAKNIAAAMKGPMDFCARWGGEEFIVILPNTDKTGAINMANDILQRIRTSSVVFTSDLVAQPTVSIGIAIGDNKNSINKRIFNYADLAMYRAKSTGRDKFSL